MGGYITLRSMVTSGDVKAGVIWAGVVASYEDMLALWNSQAGNIPEQARRWREVLVATYGTPESNPAFWDAISANRYLADLSGPIQLHHGSADLIVPQQFSDLLYRELLAAEQPVEYYIYPGDDHNIAASFNQAMTRSVAFMDVHVKGQ
jgi:dipeptidyl aminopeptidase/acylaminoacyl peptidase